jgi:hypothetical protein
VVELDLITKRLYEIRNQKKILEEEEKILRDRIHELLGTSTEHTVGNLSLTRYKPMIKVDVTDLDLIPWKFITRMADKPLIKQYFIDTGEEVQGCKITEARGALNIRAQ